MNRSHLTLCAVVGPVLFTLAWIVLGFVSTGYTMWGVEVTHYSAVQQQISALGVGNTAPFMNAAFITTGVLLILGTIGVFRVFKSDMSVRMRAWSLALWLLPGIGSIIDGFFTFEQFLPHTIGVGLALMSMFGFIVTGIALRRSPRSSHLGWWLIIAGALTAALAVLFFATFTPTAQGQLTGTAGLTERLLITEILCWYAITGWIAFGGAHDRRPHAERKPI